MTIQELKDYVNSIVIRILIAAAIAAICVAVWRSINETNRMSDFMERGTADPIVQHSK
jgi:hypothetical protein